MPAEKGVKGLPYQLRWRATAQGSTVQAYIDGLPIFTLGVYGWSSGQCGIMIGILGLVAPIINTGVGAFSARLPDRHITVSSLRVHIFCRFQNHDD